ncbi:MAG: molybdate ABC transporter substrate-binding protein [Pseudomonadota bacterium]
MGLGRKINHLLGIFAICVSVGDVAGADAVTVFAAASLKESLEEVTARFEADTDHDVSISFAGSSALARQIEFGAPADIFISASAEWMDRLAKSGSIRSETRIDLLGNRLVLITAKAEIEPHPLGVDTDLAQMLQGDRLAMALTEAVPAGIYGKAALQHLGLWADIESQVAQTDNVRAALALVALRAAPLGIVYETDAKAERRVRIVGVFPSDTHPPIVYPAALTVGTTSPAATALLDYLRSDTAHEIFEDHGFIVSRE